MMQRLSLILSSVLILGMTTLSGCQSEDTQTETWIDKKPHPIARQPDKNQDMPASPSHNPNAPELAHFTDLPVADDGTIRISDAQWRTFLTPETFHILRESGTEPRSSGPLTDHFADGTYHCAGCGLFLYDSTHKFHSGCGWPAFDDEVPNAVLRLKDSSAGMLRTEIRCKRCDGHLGHVFSGEKQTAKNIRHCVNSASLVFVPQRKREN